MAGVTWTPEMNDELLAWIADGKATAWRKAVRLTLVKAAEEVSVAWTTVALWEKGRQRPTGNNAQRYHARLKAWRRQAEQAGASRAPGQP